MINLNFVINKERDKETALFFFRQHSKQNNVFFDKFIKPVPELVKCYDLTESEATDLINTVVDNYYIIKEPELVAQIEPIKEQ